MAAPPSTTLQLSQADMRTLGYQLVDILIDHVERLPAEPVLRKANRAVLEQRLREPLPEQGSDIDLILRQVQQDVFSNVTHTDHPRCFAAVPSASNFVSAMADALVSGLNIGAGSWTLGSGPAEIELVTVDWLRQLCGMPASAGGLFVSGGSAANLTALAVARYTKLKNRVADAMVYFSDQTHPSVERALRVLGFEPRQIRKLPSDEEYRLALADLRLSVAADRTMGRVPFCVVANAGTPATGAVDPLAALADFCQEEGLWLHADGAYGASAILSDKGAALLSGLGSADSLSVDPHKWLFQPYEIGCVLVRDRYLMREAFRVFPEYLKDVYGAEDEEVNFSEYGIQTTRSFRALKLWMSFKTFGLEAFRGAIDRGIALAEEAERILRATPNWEVVTPAQLGVVTFRYVPTDRSAAHVDLVNQRIADEINADGFAALASTIVRGRIVLRLCTINPRTTEADISETILRLDQLGDEVSFW